MSERKNLFEQTKDLVNIGARLSGEPEVVRDIEDFFRENQFFPIIRDQIRAILEYVSGVFPEDWKSPGDYKELNPQQQKAYMNIAGKELQACPGPIIHIELAIDYRSGHSN